MFIFKEKIDVYMLQSSPVYIICIKDANKAFNRVSHCRLFKNPLDRGVPVFIVRLLSTRYSIHILVVKWSNVTSNLFKVSNGLRQGRILPLSLFNLYMDQLSLNLTQFGVGCKCNTTIVNHLFYADDRVLMASSPAALQKLNSECENMESVLYYVQQ